MIMQFMTLWCMSNGAVDNNYNDEHQCASSHRHLLMKGRMVKTGGAKNADYTTFPTKYAHGCIVLCFVAIFS